MSEITGNESEKSEDNVILESRDIEEAEIEKLKGDTVGKTLYSGKWIINTLLSVSKIHEEGWNESLETDLCTLWDMTTEKEIVHFLVENDFFKIAEFALNSCEEPRLMEIILGIIGNLTCESEVLEVLLVNEELLQTVLRHLSSEDAATLLQIVRFLRSAIWNIQKDADSRWRTILGTSTILREVVPFILKSSTNDELLMATTSFLRSSAEIDLPTGQTLLEELFETSSLLSGMLESFEEVLPQEDSQYSTATLKYLEDFLELFSILRKSQQILQKLTQEETLSRIIEISRRILKNFIDPWNLFPLDEIKASCVHRCAEIFLDFRWRGFIKSDSTVDIDGAVLKIVFSVSNAKKEEEEEDLKETMAELLKYLEGYWHEITKISSEQEIIDILKTIEKDTVEHAINLLRSKLTAENINTIINGLSSE